jgi:Sulfite reductase, beta subunit (hemoprotein)
VSTKYARGTADLTDRQNIQLHWIEIESVPAIWETLEAVGLSTTEACGDTPRVILGCPLAGIDADEVIDATPEIQEINERYIGSPEFSNLPRKFKSALSGCTAQCTVHEINDIAFVGVVTTRARPATTSGSAADCPPTRCSASGSAPSSGRTRCTRSGPGSPGSSATTATGGCATAPESSS